MNSFETLIFICRILSYQGEKEDKKLEEDIAGSNIEWPVVIEIASVYYLSAAIYPSLSRKGLLDFIPPEVRDYFLGVLELNRERNQKLRDQTVVFSALLNEIDVEPLLLKGMANIVLGVYEDPGIRLMNDIDAMVPEERLIDCVEKLQNAGYQDLYELGPDRHHYSPMGHPDEIGALELHTRPVVAVFGAIVPTKRMWLDSESIEVDGATVRIASATQRVLHNIVHMQLQHGAHHPMYFHQMYDLALIRKASEAEIDWPLVERSFKEGKQPGALQIYLANTERYLFCKKPELEREEWLRPLFSHWFLQIMNANKHTLQVFTRIGDYVRFLRRIRATFYAPHDIGRKLTRLGPWLEGLVKKSH